MRLFTVILLGAVVASPLALGCQKKVEERLVEEIETAEPCDCEEPCPECECEEEGPGRGAGGEGKGRGPGGEGEARGAGDDA